MGFLFDRRRKSLGCNFPISLADIAANGHHVLPVGGDEWRCTRCGALGLSEGGGDMLWGASWLSLQLCLGCPFCVGEIGVTPMLCAGKFGLHCDGVPVEFRTPAAPSDEATPMTDADRLRARLRRRS